MPKLYRLLIDGKWVETKEKIRIKNPYNNKVVATVCRAGKREMNSAISAAAAAFEKTRKLSSHERSSILQEIVEGIKSRQKEFVNAIVKEAGKPVRFAKGEAERCINTFTIAAEEAKRISGELLPLDITKASEGRIGITKRFPIGPIAAITPFNFPLNLVAHKVAPAIACGNTVMLRPASQTPISSLLLGEICQKTSLPRGALNIVSSPVSVAEILVRDSRIKKLTFTGSDVVGWNLKEKLGKKKVTLELVGNAAVVVDRDANIDAAAERIAIGAFAYAGQVCISVQRIYVHAEIFDTFKHEFLKVIREKIKYGDPTDPDTIVGPIIDAPSIKRIMDWITEAKKGGARVLIGGRRNGNFIEPTVLTNVDPKMKVSCREIFGPVAVLYSFDSFGDAMDEVNNSTFGLQAGVYTKNIHHITKAFNELDVGGVIINDYPTFRVDNMPYGGVKDSGFGREGIKYAIAEMTELKLLVLNTK